MLNRLFNWFRPPEPEVTSDQLHQQRLTKALIELTSVNQPTRLRSDYPGRSTAATELIHNNYCPLCHSHGYLGVTADFETVAQTVTCFQCGYDFWFSPPLASYVLGRKSEKERQTLCVSAER